jgi:hypothetical protein
MGLVDRQGWGQGECVAGKGGDDDEFQDRLCVEYQRK